MLQYLYILVTQKYILVTQKYILVFVVYTNDSRLLLVIQKNYTVDYVTKISHILLCKFVLFNATTERAIFLLKVVLW